MNTGKELCEMLKSIRKRIAEQYKLNYQPIACNHEGDCMGTCPRCDAELKDLQEQLEAKGISKVEIDTQINAQMDHFREGCLHHLKDQPSNEVLHTEGMPSAPEEIPAIEGDMRFVPNLIPTERRKLLKKCFIAGVGFHNIHEIWDTLRVGTKLALVRDSQNKHDKNAVAITLFDDYDNDPDNFDFDLILGYIPRTENESIALMLDMGWRELFDCEISKLNEHSPYKERIEISIYIKNKEYLDRNTKIRALLLDDEELQKVNHDLEANGFIYYRWRGLPTWQHNLPQKNDQVVFICKQEEYSILYLMHVIAIGDEAYPFVEDKEEFDRCDDCYQFVLTNVKGPIKRHNSELKFLDGEEIDQSQPESYLSQEGTELIRMIFNELS